jgi:formamidopyrimidine-DNA glycosylase
MPELPEVETVCRQLDPILRGRTLNRLQILDTKLRPKLKCFAAGSPLTEVRRRGKLLVLCFAEGGVLAVHLRMTGRLIWQPAADEAESGNAASMFVHQSSHATKHLRAVLAFDHGELAFYDSRRFGTIEPFTTFSEVPCAGLDPLNGELSLAVLQQLLKSSKQTMKSWLLRQDRIAGIGNIYASEILFDARISPQKTAQVLSRSECDRLFASIRKILRSAIEHCGTTFSDFQDSTGSVGSFQQYLQVYGRAGERCRRCRKLVKRVVEQQRSTFYCPGCQR